MNSSCLYPCTVHYHTLQRSPDGFFFLFPMSFAFLGPEHPSSTNSDTGSQEQVFVSHVVVFLSWQRRFHSLAIADKHITSARTFHHKQAAPRAAAWSYLPILLAPRTFMQEPHHSPKYYRGSALAWSRSSLIFYNIKCLTGTVSFFEAVTHIYDKYYHSSRPIRFTKLLMYWWQYNASAYS